MIIPRLIVFLFIGLFLVGCGKSNDAKLGELEKRVALLEDGSKSASNWVLWETQEWADKKRINNFGWPKVLSSFSTKEQCLDASSKFTLINGRTLNNDPWTITDGTYVFTYSCLPPSINLRKN